MTEDNEKRQEMERLDAEAKGAYSYDLHDAIRSVVHSLGNGNLVSADRELTALVSLLAPEIREAFRADIKSVDRDYHQRAEKIKKNPTVFMKQLWDPYRSINEPRQTGYDPDRMVWFQREQLHTLFGIYLNKKLETIIDVLDRHGELRKWRSVEYGKL